ncbi:hypothetical protein, partial [Xanthomonas campestris]|uniref:hypothetical protein n=1 Tax=Xanthomonas campestris TaxID=339 RepID=UPI002168BD57
VAAVRDGGTHHVGARLRATKLFREHPIARKRAPTTADACESTATSGTTLQIRLFGGGIECVTVAAVRDGGTHHVGARLRATKLFREHPIARKRAPT